MKFVKGKSGNPGGKPAISKELREDLKKFDEDIRKAILKYNRMTLNELKLIAKNPETLVLDLQIITILIKGISTADTRYNQYLLDRTVGPVHKDANIFIDNRTQNDQDNNTKLILHLPSNGFDKPLEENGEIIEIESKTTSDS